jgi:hypothetical protein
MSIVRSAAIAVSTAICAATLATGAPARAQAAERATATRSASHATRPMDTSQRVASGQTVPGQGWLSYFGVGLYIDVDTSAAHFTGAPTYTTSVGGYGNHWALTGTSAVYSPTATGFRMYIRWSDGHAMSVADAQNNGWYVNWVGVDNP